MQRPAPSRRIPQAFLNELVARTDLLELIGARVTLKRAGSSHKGLCPFHDEKTPSFTVSPDKGFYKCFGCGAYGNAIDFVIQYENRGFLEAVEILADLLHVEIPVERKAEDADEVAPLYGVLREADQIFRQALRENEAAIGYLKQRGIDGATAGRFGLGYAPPDWDTMIKALGAGPGGVERLIEAGLAVRNDKGRVYDRFRDRIIFPIRDSRGRVIGFGGRLLGPGEPKYLNSPATPLFDKGRTLYGVHEMRAVPGRPERLLVVEGYVDVIALTQAELGPAIAAMGTAATADNMRQVTRLSDRVVFCFDGDRAGRDAAWRAVESVLPFGGGKVEIDFVLLPDGEDPDSFVRGQGKAAFESLLANATSLSAFMIEQASLGLDLDHADGRARLTGKLLPLLKRLPSGFYRELIVNELAEKTGIAGESLLRQIEGEDDGTAAASARRPGTAGGRAAGPRTVMQKAVSLLLHFPEAAPAAADVPGLDEVDAPGADLLRRLLDIAAQNPHITTGQLIEAFRGEQEEPWIERLAAQELLDDESAAREVLRDSLERIVSDYRRKTRAEAIRRLGSPRP